MYKIWLLKKNYTNVILYIHALNDISIIMYVNNASFYAAYILFNCKLTVTQLHSLQLQP